MIRQEWRRLLHNKVLLVVLIAILVIPTIYTTLFLGSMWDPYGKLSELPVAVVNCDRETVYNGKLLHVGDDLVRNLRESGELAFDFVDEEQAREGLLSGKYYMVVTIPEDFSARAATVTDARPEQMELRYEVNPGSNYIASKMGESAMLRVKEGISSEVSRVYAEEMLGSVDELADGMGRAADGAASLGEGTAQLADGVRDYTDGVAALRSGADALDRESGALQSGASSLADGTAALKEGSGALVSGLGTLEQALAATPDAATVRTLTGGFEQLHTGIRTLADAAAALPDGFDTEGLAAAVGGIGSSASDAGDELGRIAAAAQQLAESELTPEQRAAVAEILSASGELQGDLGEIGENARAVGGALQQLAPVASKLPELKGAVAKLASGADAVLPGGERAVSGMAQALGSVRGAVSEQLLPGAQQLDAGASALQRGGNSLRSGVGAYTGGVGELAAGAQTLAENSGALQSGTEQLQSGAGTLAQELADGAAQVADASGSDGTAEMIAAPVELREEQATLVPDNGHAMAAYMMSVALWVGCIAFCIMYPLTEYEGELKSGLRLWAGKATVVYPVAILQAVVMFAALGIFCGFAPQEMGRTLGVACLASVAFMAVMYFFNVWLGKVGSFLMLIFMVVQLAGSAGTYPVELSGGFVAKIHRYLPFSYSVDAFRSTIAGGGSIRTAVLVLGGIAVVFTALTVLLFHVRGKRIKEGRPVLSTALEKSGLA